MPWTVTAQEASCPPAAEVAVTVVSPAATPVTRPVSPTVAMAELAVRQVTAWSAVLGETEALSWPVCPGASSRSLGLTATLAGSVGETVTLQVARMPTPPGGVTVTVMLTSLTRSLVSAVLRALTLMTRLPAAVITWTSWEALLSHSTLVPWGMAVMGWPALSCKWAVRVPSCPTFRDMVCWSRETWATTGAGSGSGVGSEVGAGVGSVVGAGVGSVVGAGVGSVVGAGVGSVVGAGVGSVVGAEVGCTVVPPPVPLWSVPVVPCSVPVVPGSVPVVPGSVPVVPGSVPLWVVSVPPPVPSAAHAAGTMVTSIASTSSRASRALPLGFFIRISSFGSG